MNNSPDKLSIVTGGSKGIGKEVVRRLSIDSNILNISRNPVLDIDYIPNSELQRQNKIFNLEIDISNIDSLKSKLLRWFDKNPGYQINRLVLNAATLNLGWLSDKNTKEFEHSIRANYIGPSLLVSYLLSNNIFNPNGATITYVTSSLARCEHELSFAGIGLYSASKAALSRLAIIQARELELTHPYITVSRVHPGIVDTNMQFELRKNQSLDKRFVEKTAQLPPYKAGDWQTIKPHQAMRTITCDMSADFILWANENGDYSATEYDYYHCEQYHTVRDQRLMAL